ncbi:MAG: glutamate-cysteine ligase family protein [Clostridia bacterium]|nr:glutamate-cysteine ligase family protein [Clostridia bacterium]
MNARDRFCEYFAKGFTDKERIGLELEHFVMKEGRPLNYSDGVCDILAEIADGCKRIFYESGKILGADMGEYTITLEPGAQLEVSVKPFEDTAQIKRVLDSFYKKAEPILTRYNATLSTIPVVDESKLVNIELIPKERYRYMDKYFLESGTMGRYMMRGSASTQISVDYDSEADFVKKFRAAYILSPVFALICSNGENKLKRLEIWDNVDEKRTYIPKALFSDDFGFEKYAEGLLNVPAIFVPMGDGFLYTGDKTVGALCEIYGIDEGMTEHFLSMVFPDVRLKQYIEIRIADAMPYERAIGYAELIKRIFYTDALDEVLNRYNGTTVDDIINAKCEIRQKGENAQIYGRSAAKEAEYLISFMR